MKRTINKPSNKNQPKSKTKKNKNHLSLKSTFSKFVRISKSKKQSLTLIAVAATFGVLILSLLITSLLSGRKLSEETFLFSDHGSVLCLSLGLRSLQCQNVETGELKKYNLPKELGDVWGFTPSPDEKHYLVQSHEYPDSTVYSNSFTGVYDATLNNPIELQLPNLKDLGDDERFISNLRWLSNETVIFTLQFIEGNENIGNSFVLCSFNIKTKTSQILYQSSEDIGSIETFGDERYVFAKLNNYNETGLPIVETEGILFDTTDWTYKKINGKFEPGQYGTTMSRQKPLLYETAFEEKGNDKTYIYELLYANQSPSLKLAATIDRSVLQPVVSTSKGILLSLYDITKPNQVELVNEKGEITVLNLSNSIGDNVYIFSLYDFPNFPEAKYNTPETSDFFQPSNDIPEKIVEFLKKRVSDPEVCASGLFITIEVGAYDGENQFTAFENGCGQTGLSYYRLKDSEYELITNTLSGLSCSERDSLGVSKVLLPNCSESGLY